LKLRSLMIIIVIILALSIPLYVYVSYPDVYLEEESLLENSAMNIAPFRPPKFLVGSLIYGSTREIYSLRKPMIERYDTRLIFKLDEAGKCPLLLAPTYSEMLTQESLSRERIADLIVQGAQTIKLAFFKTQRGIFAVVLEVTIDGRHYVIAPRR